MSTPTRVNEAIQTHYTRPDLAKTILAALEKAGKDPDRLAPEDLAPVDEFHIRGRAATLELAGAAGLDSTKRVLDVGCGIGGTSRCLAREYGCRVTGIDLTEEYCRAAAVLSERVGLTALVEYRQGDATRLPFDDESFDVVWTEHVAMNIPHKARLYAEMHRALKPGGTLAIYDVLAGPSGPVVFPVPWARTPDSSFLVRPDELRKLLEDAGFTVSSWSDTTDAARAWFVSLAEKIRKEGLPSLGFHLLLGPEFQAMAQNQRRNLEEGRIVLAQVIARKSAPQETTAMTPIPVIEAFDHLHVFVADRPSAESWYGRVLGFKRTPELAFWAAGGGPLTLQNESGSVHIALFERSPQPCRSTLALRVSAAEYLKWREHLNAVLPGQVSEEDHEASVSLYFSDPDGNPYEITTYEHAQVRRNRDAPVAAARGDR